MVPRIYGLDAQPQFTVASASQLFTLSRVGIGIEWSTSYTW
ncbi:hypothetical protein MY5147_003450 [Beauveria neobassiana]